MRRALLLAPILTTPIFAMLAACASRPAPGGANSSGAPGAAPEPPSLASEQRRLSELFRGTPVVFAMQGDGSLRVTVPRHFCFDPGAARVKPPLAAVLDRLAKSQLQTQSRLRVSTPSDPETRGTALARERALSVHDYLMGRGIGAARLQATGATQTEQVEIVTFDVAPH